MLEPTAVASRAEQALGKAPASLQHFDDFRWGEGALLAHQRRVGVVTTLCSRNIFQTAKTPLSTTEHTHTHTQREREQSSSEARPVE